MHAQVKDLCDQGIIQRSDSAYASPIVMVLKPNKTYRMCIDYRKINAIAKPFAYSLTFMDTILYELRKAH